MKRNQHLAHVPGLANSDILDTFADGFFIDHVNFLVKENNKLIELVTGFMFTKQACRVLQLKTINRFDTKTSKWENSIFYPQKYQNFHGCKLYLQGFEDWTNYDLLSLIFTSLHNATLTTEVPNEETTENAATFDLTLRESITTVNAFNTYYDDDDNGFVVANAHRYETITFVVPPGEPYTDLERMFMMFNFETWIAIAITFSIALAATISLSFVSNKIRNFIAGRDVQSPTMNLISIFLTGGQLKLPGRNFARFLFILFTFWSLIIRTCHQSMLFELMQADLRRQPKRSIDELFESQFTLHEEEIDEELYQLYSMASTGFVKRIQKFKTCSLQF